MQLDPHLMCSWKGLPAAGVPGAPMSDGDTWDLATFFDCTRKRNTSVRTRGQQRYAEVLRNVEMPPTPPPLLSNGDMWGLARVTGMKHVATKRKV